MRGFSEKVKEHIVKECFEDVCINIQKEDSGAFKGIVNAFAKPNVYLDDSKKVIVVEKKQTLAENFIYRIDKATRILILQKINEPYIFSVELNREKIDLECEQYSYKVLESSK